MADYKYKCNTCRTTEERTGIKVSDRNNQICHTCLEPLSKVINFKGSVYAPTAGGMR